jgi:hypothetical protein
MGGSAPIFLGDQVVHAFTLLSAAWLLTPTSSPPTGFWPTHSDTILILSLAYLTLIFACGYVNAVLLLPLAKKVPVQQASAEDQALPDPGLAQAGMIIGWLERFLILTAILLGSPTAAALVVGAKSVFRLEGIRMGRRAAEYFLIGTLLSVSEATVVGLMALYLLS